MAGSFLKAIHAASPLIVLRTRTPYRILYRKRNIGTGEILPFVVALLQLPRIDPPCTLFATNFPYAHNKLYI